MWPFYLQVGDNVAFLLTGRWQCCHSRLEYSHPAIWWTLPEVLCMIILTDSFALLSETRSKDNSETQESTESLHPPTWTLTFILYMITLTTSLFLASQKKENGIHSLMYSQVPMELVLTTNFSTGIFWMMASTTAILSDFNCAYRITWMARLDQMWDFILH